MEIFNNLGALSCIDRSTYIQSSCKNAGIHFIVFYPLYYDGKNASFPFFNHPDSWLPLMYC